MAVPKYSDFYNVFLESLADGQPHAYNDSKDYVKAKMNLSEEDLAEITSSGYALWVNRLGWCATYLKKAGLVISPKRSFFQITESGKKLLDERVIITNRLMRERYPSFASFQYSGRKPAPHAVTNQDIEQEEISEETPQEMLDRVYQEVNTQLAEDLLAQVVSMSPAFFERLVVQLMESMGYGGYDGAGVVTKMSGDAGIDGIINEDQLGFSQIYIQAKKWSPDHSVGRQELQQFAGAMMGPPKVEKGLFVTTTKFTKGAEDFARAQHIILVDGTKLAQLMIKFNVGVTTQKTYAVKRIDSDFFENE